MNEYLIYKAKLLGSSAVLLTCSILSEEQIKAYINICDKLGLSALVEAHDEKEIQTALSADARIIMGSAIIKRLEKYGKDTPKYIGEYVKPMKDALR